MAHLPDGHIFGVKCKVDEFNVCQLVGNTYEPKAKYCIEKDKTKRPPAGLQNHHSDDLDQQKHIVPRLHALEDKTLVRKITEDVVGGVVLRQLPKHLCNVFGVPSVRDPSGRRGPKKLADEIVNP